MPEGYPACRGKAITSHVIEGRPAKPHYAIDRTHGSALMHPDPNVGTTRDSRTMAEQMDTRFLRRVSMASLLSCPRETLCNDRRRGQVTPEQQSKTLQRGKEHEIF